MLHDGVKISSQVENWHMQFTLFKQNLRINIYIVFIIPYVLDHWIPTDQMKRSVFVSYN